MPLTPEQQKASDWLGESIKDYMYQLGYCKPDMVMTDWVVCVAQQGFEPDGGGMTGVSYLIPNDQLAWHRMIGLVETVRWRMQANFNSEGEEG